jgi:low affinity Fe/Cu permease
MKPNASGRFNHWFGLAARHTARASGNPLTFVLAVAVIVVWGVTGPLFGFSDTWQLIINTGTTIVTFLMVFLIQNTQNRDSEAVQLKLDELIRALHGAENSLIDLEDMEIEELDRLRSKYAAFAEDARRAAEARHGKRTEDRNAGSTRKSRRANPKSGPASSRASGRAAKE